MPLYLFAGGATLLACSIIIIGITQAPALLGHAGSSQGNTLIVVEGEDSEALPLGALIDRAERALAAGDLHIAMELYEKALEMGGDIQVMRRLFDTAVLIGDRQKAESVLGLLAFRGIQESTINALRGMLLLREGDIERARNVFMANPQHPEQAFGLVLVHILSLEHELAKNQLAHLHQTRDPLLSHMARTIQGAYDEFELFEDGKESHRMTLLSRALSQIGQYPLAREILKDIVASESEYRDAWILLGHSNLILQNYDAALAAFNRAYAIDPEKAEIQYFLGLTHERMGSHTDAAMFMGYALQNGFTPQRAVREKLAEMAKERGAFMEAAEQYRAILNSGEADATLAHIFVSLLVNDLDDIEGAREAAISIHEEMGDLPEVLDLVGWTSLLTGELDQAAIFLNSATTQDPTLASAWLHKGLLEEQVGSFGDAVSSYRKAYELSLGVDPDLAEVAAELHNGLVSNI